MKSAEHLVQPEDLVLRLFSVYFRRMRTQAESAFPVGLWRRARTFRRPAARRKCARAPGAQRKISKKFESGFLKRKPPASSDGCRPSIESRPERIGISRQSADGCSWTGKKRRSRRSLPQPTPADAGRRQPPSAGHPPASARAERGSQVPDERSSLQREDGWEPRVQSELRRARAESDRESRLPAAD